jgi:hypothetical protein
MRNVTDRRSNTSASMGSNSGHNVATCTECQRGVVVNLVSEKELKNDGVLMAAYCILCAGALSMAALLAVFGENFLAIF